MKELDVLHESDNFIIVNKEYDLIINTDDVSRSSLQKQLSNRFPNKVNKNLHFGFYFPHRLDFATSGVICIALSKKSCAAASTAFQNRSSKKFYLALLRGHVAKKFVKITEPIVELDNSLVRTGSESEGRPACSILLVLEYGVYESKPATKVLLQALTGRRHQLRVHCSFIGHTIIGDFTYSNKQDMSPPRMFLHSLRLILPNDLEEIDISTPDPFTEEMTPEWKITEEINQLNASFKCISDFNSEL